MKKYLYLEKIAKKCIDTASKSEESIIMMMVDWFQTDEESLMLRDFLWYARDKWVVVHFIPKYKK